ncbi:GtrA family protein [Chromohalobacter israelensis]|uniref:GtrA-like protein n=1 Tax=Chromohalobacter israelensis (strain ATCC BAA-138 / DSM 3043 / CIP 106854 / NCIMB 13768 / 1H11) TaxID=290398 RepID=Q1QY56_CHRI1|nr:MULTISPECIES: GtrA family protein [Chromohalobacter]ABE58602.1 GtrA-like protein [Chromohalobacter salexigens DSM 3043]MBZ5875355.1 GtrA family protein [Chromohalobacter salexigens]MDF9433075.1 GtrA family protein [Chromohalobacter israelensis]MDO0944724.1 GtrA family protein [Chromohalobacter salexigens]NWO54933.1 GtrA family protein [Chromohalobacter salexigens]
MRRLAGEAGTAARFGLVGIAATGVHLLVAGVLLGTWPSMSEFLANVVAFLAAFQVSLMGHRRVTFRRRGRAKRFFLVALAGFGLNNGVLGTLLATTPVQGFLAVAIATLTVPVLTYLASRFWAFRETH